jgi:hypothetical protein
MHRGYSRRTQAYVPQADDPRRAQRIGMISGVARKTANPW